MKIVAVITVVGLLWACLQPAVLASVPRFLGGLLGPGGPMPRPWDPSDRDQAAHRDHFRWPGRLLDSAVLLLAAGEGSGMAAHVGRITGPMPESPSRYRPTAGFRPTIAETRVRWHAWRRYLTIDALVGICGNLATTLMTCLLAWALLFPQGLLPKDYQLAWCRAGFFE